MTPAAVAYVIPRMSIGGAQTHLLHVLRRLDRRRFTPLLCCLATDRDGADPARPRARAAASRSSTRACATPPTRSCARTPCSRWRASPAS